VSFRRGGPWCAAVAIALVVASAAPARAEVDLPPPPMAGTAADAADRAGAAAAFGAERIAQANRDRALDPFLAFGGILGDGFAGDALPATRRLLGAVQAAVSRSIVEAKGMFPRARPYAADPQLQRCGGTLFLAMQRSYPSGHAAIGQAWGVVLAALLPARSTALLTRGADFGSSRIVCGFHWPSDVGAGQAIGAAVAAAVLADPAFARLIGRAREELAPLSE
jgi:acid phosphatase (class A)